MIVVANGGYRTGSTFIYNALIAIFEENFDKFERGVLPHDKIMKIDKKKNWVIKSHNWLPPKSTDIKSIYTRRYFLDVVSSMKKVQLKLDPILEIVEEKRRDKYMLSRECLTLDYEDFYDNEKWAIDRMCEYLGLTADTENIAQKFCRGAMKIITDAGNGGSMGFVKGHISEDARPGNFVYSLSPAEVFKVTKAYMGAGSEEK